MKQEALYHLENDVAKLLASKQMALVLFVNDAFDNTSYAIQQGIDFSTIRWIMDLHS